MSRPALLFLALCLGSVPAASAQQKPKHCLLRIANTDRRFASDSTFGGNTTFALGGNVKLQCVGELVYFGGDSVYGLNGEAVYFYTKAYYRDPDYTIDADTLSYTKQTEFLKASGHVVIHDLKSGSSLTGPYVEYKRAVKGIRDSAEVLGLSRPTVKYFTEGSPSDKNRGNPYTIVANILHGFGQSRLRAIGDALIDRDSLHASGDSISFVQGKSAVARIWGTPGIIRRATKDSFFVLGKLLIIGLQDDKIRDVRAFGLAHVNNAGSQVVADSIVMTFTSEKLGLTLAWDRLSAATVLNAGYFVRGDSVAIETPGELLHELRVFGHAQVQNPVDTARPRLAPKRTMEDTVESIFPERDTMWGDRITARFEQVDSSGTTLTRLKDVGALAGKSDRARSFFARQVAKNKTTSPSVTYLRADTIRVEMQPRDTSGVSIVEAHGHVDGGQAETASKPKAAGDSLKAVPPVKRPGGTTP